MDQAVSLNAEKNKICIVDFNPVRVHQVPFLENIKIAVFSSLKDSKKATGSCNFYNTRVAECRVGCALLYQKYVLNEGNFAENLPDHILMGLDV